MARLRQTDETYYESRLQEARATAGYSRSEQVQEEQRVAELRHELQEWQERALAIEQDHAEILMVNQQHAVAGGVPHPCHDVNENENSHLAAVGVTGRASRPTSTIPQSYHEGLSRPYGYDGMTEVQSNRQRGNAAMGFAPRLPSRERDRRYDEEDRHYREEDERRDREPYSRGYEYRDRQRIKELRKVEVPHTRRLPS